MSKTRNPVICFVGHSGPVKEVSNQVLLVHNMQTRVFPCVDDCRESLCGEAYDLVLIDFDGDAIPKFELLAELQQVLPRVPKVALVEKGDIPMAIQAIRQGAANCFEKPIDAQELCAEIQDLIGEATSDLVQPILTLTRMEKTVLHWILEGMTTYEIAQILHRSPRTIEVHRCHIMHKLGVSNPVELIKTAASLGLFSPSTSQGQETHSHPA